MIFIIQIAIGFIFLVIGIKVVKRYRHISTSLLGSSFLLIFLFTVVNPLIILFKLNILIRIIYYLMLFFLFFTPILIVLFLYSIFDRDLTSYSRKLVFPLVIHAIIIIIIILLVPSSINFEFNGTWEPVWNFYFSVTIGFYEFFTIVIPSIIFSHKILKSLKDKKVRNRFILLLIGIFGMYFEVFGIVIYNTSPDNIVNKIWIYIGLLELIFPLLIYYGIGKTMV